MHDLVGLYYSPWTERARWALDYHGIAYRYTEYTTLLGEPLLRLRARQPFGKVSVPFLATAQGPVTDSLEIACFADRHSGRPALVPVAQAEDIRQWTADAELALCSARIRATRRIRRSTAALAERLPDYVPGALRKPLVPMAFVGASYVLNKYDLAIDDDQSLLENMDFFLAGAQKALAGRDFVFERFGFADMVIATMLQAVTPVASRYIPLGAGSLAVMCEPELATRYPRLIEWRDEVYYRYR